MADIRDFSLVQQIYKTYETEDRQSRRLGGSILGEDCERAIWYSFRHAKKKIIPGRIKRLFSTGHEREARIVNELIQAGHIVELTGSNQEYLEYAHGHAVDVPDGLMDGKYSLEIKTHNDKNWKSAIKQIPKKHYDQITLHMGLKGTEKGYYIADNKNTDELHAEKVRLDKRHFNRLVQKAERIIDSGFPPVRISDRVDSFACKFCDYKGICHMNEEMDKNCRTCKNSVAADGGLWWCMQHDRECGEVCENYESIKDA